jgi:hypothetical protein
MGRTIPSFRIASMMEEKEESKFLLIKTIKNTGNSIKN